MHTIAMTETTAPAPERREPTEAQRAPLRTRAAADWTKTAQRYLPEEHAALVRGATQANVSINDYVRRAVIAALVADGITVEEG